MRATRSILVSGNHVHRADGSFKIVSRADDSSELVLERHSEPVRVSVPMHEAIAETDSGRWKVFGPDGVWLNQPDYESSIVGLTEEDQALFEWRKSFVVAAEGHPPYGPDNPIFVRVIDETYKRNVEAHKRDRNLKVRNIWCTSVKPWTVYGWRLLVRDAQGDYSVLAPKPRPGVESALDPDVEAIIQGALEEVVTSCKKAVKDRRTGQQPTPYVPTIRVVERAVKGKVDEANKRRAADGKPTLLCPAFETIRKRYHGLDKHLLCNAQYGPHVAQKLFGPFGKSHQFDHILQRVEIDFFYGDVALVIEFLGLLIPLGRPILAVAIDCTSRAILGVVVEFAEPTTETVLSLLKQIVSPKSAIWSLFPNIQNKRDIYGRPVLVSCDNAWVFDSRDFNAALNDLDVVFLPAGIRTPWHKPFIESFGGTMGVRLHRLLPGQILNIGDSRLLEWDPLAAAQLEWTDFLKRLWRWVCDVYHADAHSGLGGLSPMQYWFHCLARMAGEGADSLFAPSGREVDFKVARRFQLPCGPQGITLQNRRYDNTELNKLFRTCDRKTLYDVRGDVLDVNRIMVADPRLPAPIYVPSAIQYPPGLTPKAFKEMEARRKLLGVINNALVANAERALSAASPVRAVKAPKLSPEMRAALQLLSNPDASRLVAALTSDMGAPGAPGELSLEQLAQELWTSNPRGNDQ